MMGNNIISEVIKFFQDGSFRWHTKLLVPVTIIVALFILNDAIGFTFYYTNSRKVEQVARITETLKDTMLPQRLRNELEALRSEILGRRMWNTTYDMFNSFFENEDTINLTASTIPDTAKTSNINIANNIKVIIQPNTIDSTEGSIKSINDSDFSIDTLTNKTIEITPHNPVKARNNFIFLLCSSWTSIVLLIFSVIVLFSKLKLREKLYGMLSMQVIAILIGLLFYWLFGLLFTSPIFGYWWITYTIVAIIHLFLVSIFIALVTQKTSKKSKNN